MTGFGQSEGGLPSLSWRWELKSVNARGLDVRCRLGPQFDRLEVEVKARIARRLKRGTITAALAATTGVGSAAIRVNRENLDLVVREIVELSRRLDMAPPRPEGVLALRGVLEAGDEQVLEDDTRSAQDAAVLGGLDRALDSLDESRAAEGKALGEVAAGLLGDIGSLAEAARQEAARREETLRARFLKQVNRLLEDTEGLSQERLHQEVAILLVKADVREELDRLVSHIDQAHALLAAEGAIGRQLDFLTQEMNREANTLCSKAATAELTRIGLDLKTAIDRLREQVQNIE